MQVLVVFVDDESSGVDGNQTVCFVRTDSCEDRFLSTQGPIKARRRGMNDQSKYLVETSHPKNHQSKE